MEDLLQKIKILGVQNPRNFPKIYRMSDLNYNDIKTEKLEQIEKKPRKTTNFHELTRALSPKRKSTKILLLDAQARRNRQSIFNRKHTKVDFELKKPPQIIKNLTPNKKDSMNTEKNSEDSQHFFSPLPLSPEKTHERVSEKNRFMKLRKILINAKNTRNDSFMDAGLHYAKVLQNKDNINFSSVSNIANLNLLENFPKEDKKEDLQKEWNRAIKLIETPILNEAEKIEDFKEAFARIHVFTIFILFIKVIFSL